MDLETRGKGETAAALVAGVVVIGLLLWLLGRKQEDGPPAWQIQPPPAEVQRGTVLTDKPALFQVAEAGRVLFPIIDQFSGEATEEEKSQWVGAAVCGECHEENWKSAQHSGHYNTSHFASAARLLGEYEGEGSRMPTGDPELAFRMAHQEGRFYQTVLESGRETHRASIDVIIGSGKLAQTYGTWVKDALFELPVSYYAQAGSWVYSPGYRDGMAFFARPINSGCLDCHTTGYVPRVEHEKNYRFKSRHIIAGVTCERCHGKGREHVDFHRTNPDDTVARFIAVPAELNSVGGNSLCSECHGGLKEAGDDQHAPSVHSNNQLQRLEQSACFTRSGGMSCTRCHNPHRLERGDKKLFAQRCRTCHGVDDCHAVTPERRSHFEDNCTECHMQRQTMTDIDFRSTTGEVVSGFRTDKGLVLPQMVDHYIRVFRTNANSRPATGASATVAR